MVNHAELERRAAEALGPDRDRASKAEVVKALAGIVADLRSLMKDTEGVETYDGEGMPYTMDWARLLPGGKYEYLTHWNEALAALAAVGEET